MKIIILIFIFVVVLEAPPTVAQDNPMQLDQRISSAKGATTLSNLSPDNAWPSPVADQEPFSFFLTEILEYRLKEKNDAARWDIFAWHGGDYNRLWVKSEGSASTSETSGEADFQLLYGRLISRYFDFQAGLRYEQVWKDDSDHSRGFFAVGVQGLAPYYFELEPTLFLSEDGDLSARVTATYDVRVTQRLVLQPRIEGNAAAENQEKFGVGSGLNDMELGIRLRYEVSREFAPYFGIIWERSFGNTAELLRREGEDNSDYSAVAGIRMWF